MHNGNLPAGPGSRRINTTDIVKWGVFSTVSGSSRRSLASLEWELICRSTVIRYWVIITMTTIFPVASGFGHWSDRERYGKLNQMTSANPNRIAHLNGLNDSGAWSEGFTHDRCKDRGARVTPGVACGEIGRYVKFRGQKSFR
jgi:hypothetical protein